MTAAPIFFYRPLSQRAAGEGAGSPATAMVSADAAGPASPTIDRSVRHSLAVASPAVSEPISSVPAFSSRDGIGFRTGADGQHPVAVPSQELIGGDGMPAPHFLLPGTGAGGSIASVMECRLDHMANGHTPASDAAKGIGLLAIMARRYAEAAHTFTKKPKIDRDHRMLRNKLVRCAAACLAAIDALDHKPAATPSTQKELGHAPR